MALIGSLNPAVAGLTIQQRKIEVVGDNIANIDAPSFKSARTEFSTMFSQILSFGSAPEGSFGGINPTQLGKGTQLAGITRDFRQGAIRSTGVPSDLAIDGNGFFIVNQPGQGQFYTRDGSFALSANSLLIDPATGATVQGWMADANFNVSPGGPLEELTIPVGTLSIAKETTAVSIQGMLDLAGNLGSSGTLQFSVPLFDATSTNTDLISAENPLGLDRATAATPLADLVFGVGDFTPYTATTTGTAGTAAPLFGDLQTNPNGLEISLSVDKGDRQINTPTFVVGQPAPAGGSTLGDLVGFIQDTFGITDGTIDGAEVAENTFSYQRVHSGTGSLISGTITSSDTTSINSITISGGDLRGVRPGDFIRLTSGTTAGQAAEILSVADTDADGLPDTIALRADGFNSLSSTPKIGDTYSIHAPAGVRVAQVEQLTTVTTATAPSVTTNGGITSFTITDPSVTNFADEHGVAANQTVQYTAGGSTVQGVVTAVVGNSITVSYSSALSQAPSGTSFSILRDTPGSIELAGNVGTANAIGEIDMLAGDDAVTLFSKPALANALGESVNTTFTVYDSLGTPREIEMTFVYESATQNGPNIVRYFAESSDDADRSRVVGNGSIVFNSSGQFLTTSSSPEQISLDLEPTPDQGQGVSTPLILDVDLSRMSMLSGAVSTVRLEEQDGFRAGTLRDYSIATDGTITGLFDNGLTRSLGQVGIASFPNANGLAVIGDNYFANAPNAGTVTIGEAGTLGLGTMRSGALEESNVDLAEQFTELITGQRAFQANARIVTASDVLLQELVNLI